MRDGTMDDDDIAFVESRCIENLSIEERETFTNAIHLAPMWKVANDVLIDYLINTLDGPIAKLRAKLNSNKHTKCCIRNCNIPVSNALCPRGKIMLLTNFVVEQNIFSESVGELLSMHFADPAGPDAEDPVGYAIVDFPHSTIPHEDRLIPHLPSTCVPVPIVKARCDRGCCGMEAISLRMAISPTGHKSQCMTIARGEKFDKVVIHLPADAKSVPAGLKDDHDESSQAHCRLLLCQQSLGPQQKLLAGHWQGSCQYPALRLSGPDHQPV